MTDQERIVELENKIKSLHEGYRKQLLNLEKFKAMVMNLNQGLMVVDNDDIITKVYESFEKLTGYKEEELLGKKAKDVFLKNGDVLAQLQFEEQNKYRDQGETSSYELPITKKDGQELWVSISGAPLYDDHGNKIGSIGIHYDISRQKRLQQALQAAREESDSAKHAEEKFLAKMSHEIRTPLNAVIGMSYLLRGTNLSEEQQEYVDVISRSGSLLLNLINDILDYSKIISGQIQVRPVICDLNSVILDMAQTFRLKALGSPVQVLTNLDIISSKVKVDETLLNQVLMNLIGNSEKFTEEGSITIKVEPLAEFDKTITYQFSITDTGTGIAQDRIEAIFQEFVQEEGIHIKDAKGGTGLGLAITKKIVEKMGGKIWAESIEGVGTEMHFVLTFEFAEAQEVTTHDEPKKHVFSEQKTSISPKTKVLVAEDNAMNQKYISRILDKANVINKIVGDGEQAAQVCASEHFDVIFMDLFMPLADGFEATENIRKNETSKNRNTLIYALTATAVQQHKKKALAVGMNGFISKPFHPEEIHGVLREVSMKENSPTFQENKEPMEYTYDNAFDYDTIEMYYGKDISYALEMFEIFVEQLEESHPLILQAINSGDRSSLRHYVHKLKPTFTMVGFPQITKFFEQWELDID